MNSGAAPASAWRGFDAGNGSLAAYLVLAVVLHGWRLLLGEHSAIEYHDTFDSEWPRLVNEARAFLNFGPQAWFTNIAGGMPANAFHFTQFHPLVLAHLVLPPWAVFDLLLMLNWLVAGYGLCRLLAVNFGIGSIPAFWFGVAYASSAQANVLPEFSYECAFPLIASLLHRPGRLLPAAAAVTFLTSLAYPVIHSPAFAIEHVVLLLLFWVRGSLDLQSALRAAVYWAGYALAFSPNLLALVAYLPYSHRVYESSTFTGLGDVLSYFPVAFADALNLQFWQYGLAGALLGALAAARWNRELWVGTAAVVICTAVVSVFGSRLATLLYGTFLQKMDLVNLMRMLPSLFWVLIGLALEHTQLFGRRVARYAIGATAGLVLVGLSSRYYALDSWWTPPALAMPVFVVLVARRRLILPWRPFRLRWITAAVAGVLIVSGAGQVAWNNSLRYDAVYGDTGIYRALLHEAVADPFRVTVSGFFPSAVQVAGLETVDGRSPVFDRTFKELFALVAIRPPTDLQGKFWGYWHDLLIDDLAGHPVAAADIRLPVLGALNVRYIVAGHPIAGLQRIIVAPTPGRRGPTLYLYRVPGSLPRGYYASDARLVDSHAEARALLAALPDDAWSSAVVLAREDGATSVPPAARAACGDSRLVEYRPDRLVFHLDGRRECLFVVANNYNQWWRAAIDGAPAPISRANLAFQAVVVPAGQHRLIITYQPPFFPWSLTLVPLGLLLVFAAFILRPASRPMDGRERSSGATERLPG